MASEFVYIEINVVCAIIVILMVMNEKFHVDNYKAMRNVYLSEAVFFLLDVLGDSLIGSSHPVALSYAVNSLYFIFSVLAPMYWLIYVKTRLTKPFTKKELALASIPMFVIILLAVTAPLNGWLFYMDEANIYHRGTLYLVQPVVSIAYGAVAAAYALWAKKGADTYEARKFASTLSFYPIFPMIAAVLDSAIAEIPFYCPVTTIAMVYVYLNSQNQMISRDVLTGLNNRFELQRYMVDKKRTGMYLMMIDVNHFKFINDNYGHKVGDTVLKRVANILTEVCRKYNLFCARYGGDEFLVALPPMPEDLVEVIKKEIETEVANSAQGGDLVLSVSVGYACCDFENMTEDENFSVADRMMYEEKARHNLLRK